MDVSCCILALATFGSVSMLLWGLAALIPFVLHLWFHRTRQEMPWAAMQFLRLAMQKHARQIRLQQLLLLLMRVAVLLLLAIALANPLLTPAGSAGRGPAASLSVLVIDSSYSMRYGAGDSTRWEAARQAARQCVRDALPDHRFGLVQMANPPQPVVELPGLVSDEILPEIDALQPTSGGADLVSVLEVLIKMLSSAAPFEGSLPAPRVVFITDLCRTTWQAVERSECRAQLDELSRHASLELVDVGQKVQPNVAITALRKDETSGLINETVRFSARIHNFSDQPARNRQLSWLVDEQLISQLSVTLEAGEEIEAEFAYAFPSPGDCRVRVQLEPDQLPIDDSRYGVLTIRKSLRVLCVNGEPGAGRFIGVALAPNTSAQASIIVEQVGESAVLERDLRAYDAIFLCHVRRFYEEESLAYAEFLRRGGGLIIFPGGNMDTNSYNRLLGSILPARLAGPVTRGAYRFDPRDYEHPLVAPFRGYPQSGLTTTPIAQYYEAVPHGAAQVALWYNSGDPAILTQTVLRGCCVLVTTPAAPVLVDDPSASRQTWNDWYLWPSFPPLVHEALRFATNAEAVLQQALVAAPFQDLLDAPDGELEAHLTRPDGTVYNLRTVSQNSWLTLRWPGLDRPGFYELTTEPPLSRNRWYAVNVDTNESDLTRTSRAALPLSLQPQAPRPSAQDAPPSVSTDSRPLFRWVLAAVCGLILGESWVAMRLGRNSA